ncbi:MAG: hypothetical protein PHU64_00320 [Candidatus Omnitrophica bacterium]|nr:hypothetical protein [Candidatus Omnitrophota bacterium]
MDLKKGGCMKNLIAGVKKLSEPMFIVFAVSKLLVGLGLGILLANYLMPLGWPALIIGVILSVICIVLAAQSK